jgi:hypothetical protein
MAFIPFGNVKSGGLDGALADIGNDFHIRVGMTAEPGAGRDLVVVPDKEGQVDDSPYCCPPKTTKWWRASSQP